MNSITNYLSSLILTGLLSTFVVVGDSVAQPPSDGTFHHRVLWMINPQSEAVLSWSTRQEGTSHRVYYDTVSRGGALDEYAHETTTFKDGKFTMVDADANYVDPAYYHHTHLDGLETDTTYYVVFASDTMTSKEFHFRTAPTDDKDFSMLFGGDSRIGGSEPYDHNDRQKMNQRMATLFEEKDDIYGLIHGGDYCQLSEWRYIEPWLSDHELTTTSSGRLLPIVPARGNHDRGIIFEEKFAWPDLATNYYYETELSNRFSLVTLNTEISLAGDQKEWLASTLAKTRPAHDWVVVSYHRPSYSSVRSMQDGAPRRENWVPHFEEHNVDLVLESHDHALKRTVPIRDGKINMENGITYIGDGGLGVPQRTPDTKRWWLAEPGFATSAHHCHVLRFQSDKLHVTAYGMEGDVLDDFKLDPKAVLSEQ